MVALILFERKSKAPKMADNIIIYFKTFLSQLFVRQIEIQLAYAKMYIYLITMSFSFNCFSAKINKNK